MTQEPRIRVGIAARPLLSACIELAASALDVETVVLDDPASSAVDPPALAVIEVRDDRPVPYLAFPHLAVVSGRGLRPKLDAIARGALDVIGIPMDAAELVLRIAVALSRVTGQSPLIRDQITRGDVRIDFTTSRVHINGSSTHLSPLEQRIFLVLLAGDGAVATRDDILALVWGSEDEPRSNLIDRHVRDLRRKLFDDWRNPSYIVTTRGRGYSFQRPANTNSGGVAGS